MPIAVKELVILRDVCFSSRGIVEGINFFSKHLVLMMPTPSIKMLEAQKKKTFAGNEFSRKKTLGIVGLGAIGSMLAQGFSSTWHEV